VKVLRGPLAASVLLALSCAKKPAAAPRDPSEGEDPAICQDPGLTLGTYALIPADARLAASVRLDHEEIDQALSHLAELKAPHPLPIVVATTLSHLETQVDLLRRVLQGAGFDPAELLMLTTRDGDQAWLWRSTCDLDVASASVERAWNVHVRQTTGGLVGSPAAHAPDAFAYDVLFLPGELLALVPAGNASRVRLWLGGLQARQPPSGDSLTPGARLERMQPAAVVVVMTGAGLLPSEVGPHACTPRQLRAAASGLEIDGTA
jgi:hypothetical protein